MLDHTWKMKVREDAQERYILRKKCPCLEIFFYVFSGIWTEYRDLQNKSLNSVQKNLNDGHFHTVIE